MSNSIDDLYTYDECHWQALFPLSEFKSTYGYRPSGSSVTSPSHLAYNLQLRAAREEELYGYTSLWTDIFVFGVGEPTRRDVTKVNGLPYRPAGIPWPRCQGAPLTFLAQFRFAESRDIIGPLPGDILLVFAKDELPAFGDGNAFTFEWYDVGHDPNSLLRIEDLPPPGWEFFNGFGVRHRALDYPNTQSVFHDVSSGHRLAILHGTKIGGVTCSQNFDSDVGVKGQFLCSIGSICCAFDTPFPWVNQREPLSHKNSIQKCNALTWGDGGSLVFHIDGNGMIHWDLSCN